MVVRPVEEGLEEMGSDFELFQNCRVAQRSALLPSQHSMGLLRYAWCDRFPSMTRRQRNLQYPPNALEQFIGCPACMGFYPSQQWLSGDQGP